MPREIISSGLHASAFETKGTQKFPIKEFTQNMAPFIEKYGSEDCMDKFRMHLWPNGGQPIDVEKFEWGSIEEELSFVPQKVVRPVFLAMQVEAPPITYANALAGPQFVREESPVWAKFIDQDWLPEEHLHYVPLAEYLRRGGFLTSAEINAAVDEAGNSQFPYGQSYSALERATYLSLLEFQAADFYNQTYEFLPTDQKGKILTPLLGKVLHTIGPQETVHKVFARTFVKAKVIEDPDRKNEVRNAVANFVMPGQFTASEIQKEGAQMIKDMNFNMGSSLRRILEQVTEMLDGYEYVDGKKVISRKGYDDIGKIGRMFLARQKLHLLRPILELGKLKYPLIDHRVGIELYTRAKKADDNKRGLKPQIA